MANIDDYPLSGDSEDEMDAECKELALTELVEIVSDVVARTAIRYDEENEIREMIDYNM